MSKVELFEQFMHDLQSNKQAIITQLADKEDKINILQGELKSAESLLPTAKETNPEMAESLQDRIELIKTALKQAKDDYQSLNDKHKDLNPERLATDAVEELDNDILDIWKEFGESVRRCQEARKEYLQTIAEMGAVCNRGNNKIELAKRIGIHTPNKPKNTAQLSTHLFPFSISIDDLRAAYFRGKIQ